MTNPGLLPDGTPNPAYQQALYQHNGRTPPANMHHPHPPAHNLWYDRPQQQQPPPHAHPMSNPYPAYGNPPAPNNPHHPPQQHAQYNPYGSQPSPYGQPPPPVPPPPPPHNAYGGHAHSHTQHTHGHHHATYTPTPSSGGGGGGGGSAPPYGAPHSAYSPYGPAGSHANHGMPLRSAATGGSGSTFSPSGRRKALLVGINYRGTTAELRGCVRDVTFVHHLLTTKFGFRTPDFVVLTDESTGISGVRKGSPTRRTILSSLRWLVAGSRPGDSLWFSFSGHGSQVRDTSGDESDGYDETILPVDYKKAGHIIDDELYDIVKGVARGARLTVLLDACHSGTGLDLPYQHDVFGPGTGQRISASGPKPSIAQGLMGVAGALLNGNPSGAISAGLSLANRKRRKPQPAPDTNAGEVLLFSGCMDNQTSADTSKLSGGLTTGAMTYALIETLEHSTVGDWRNYTYRKLLQTMRQKLRANRMTQVPQFSTSHPFNLDALFVL